MSRAKDLVALKGAWTNAECADACAELVRLDASVEHWQEAARAEADARTQDQVLIAKLTSERDALRNLVQPMGLGASSKASYSDLVSDGGMDPRNAADAAAAQTMAAPAQPGVLHDIDQAFYKLTVAQRDQAWAENERLKAQIAEWKGLTDAERGEAWHESRGESEGFAVAVEALLRKKNAQPQQAESQSPRWPAQRP